MTDKRGIIGNQKPSGKQRKPVVTASNSNEFVSRLNSMPNTTSVSPAPVKKKKEDVHPFYHAGKTAKVSDHVLYKLKTLSSFIQSKEGADKETMNEYIDVLAEFYIENALTEQERATYQQIYDVTTAPKRKS